MSMLIANTSTNTPVTNTQRTMCLLYADTAVRYADAAAAQARTRPVRYAGSRPGINIAPSRVMHAARAALFTDLDGYITAVGGTVTQEQVAHDLAVAAARWADENPFIVVGKYPPYGDAYDTVYQWVIPLVGDTAVDHTTHIDVAARIGAIHRDVMVAALAADPDHRDVADNVPQCEEWSHWDTVDDVARDTLRALPYNMQREHAGIEPPATDRCMVVARRVRDLALPVTHRTASADVARYTAVDTSRVTDGIAVGVRGA